MTYAITGSASIIGSIVALIHAVRAPYILLVDADFYFSARFENDVWFAASDSKRLNALSAATRYIDRLNYHGTKTLATQFLEFPRNDGTIVPEDIKTACCEIAYNLLDGRDPEFESEHAHVAQSGIASVRMVKDTDNTPIHILYNIPSSIAWAYLRPHLADINTLQLQRIN